MPHGTMLTTLMLSSVHKGWSLPCGHMQRLCVGRVGNAAGPVNGFTLKRNSERAVQPLSPLPSLKQRSWAGWMRWALFVVGADRQLISRGTLCKAST